MGLERFGGSACPVPWQLLTVKDIQIGHVEKNGKKSRKAWSDVYKNTLNYLPLCVLCNYRMRDLRDECHTYAKPFREEVAKYTSAYGGIQASKKFHVDHNTALKWRAELGLLKFTGAR